ncbi:hypothetical protein [Mesorhizobium sp. ES1-4]|uniref:hypothetical protein n=1 Tax=Mesorhizobium sp. ES1-4 TaxID=2876627 RepID=UPI001CC920D2|nr:hypothetical protein [Mesorhizobium sp. ES1-4]MBZ9796055.1 hypothetical protein [Mesorhizobium sp. ES1-4]
MTLLRFALADLVSEIDHLFAYGHFAKPGKLILLMHDQLFHDSFYGKAKLTNLITALKLRHDAEQSRAMTTEPNRVR